MWIDRGKSAELPMDSTEFLLLLYVEISIRGIVSINDGWDMVDEISEKLKQSSQSCHTTHREGLFWWLPLKTLLMHSDSFVSLISQN